MSEEQVAILDLPKHTSDIIASLIILVISGAGFVGGYFQNNFATDSSDLFDLSDDLMEEAAEIRSEIDYYIEEERAIQQDVEQLKEDIFVLIT